MTGLSKVMEKPKVEVEQPAKSVTGEENGIMA